VVHAVIEVTNTLPEACEGELYIYAVSETGKTVAEAHCKTMLQIEGKTSVEAYLTVTSPMLWDTDDTHLYILRTVLNIKSGHTGNLGFSTVCSYNDTLRHAYYVDFEAAGALRGRLIRDRALDFYIAGDKEDNMQLVPFEAYLSVCRALVSYPFRCTPFTSRAYGAGFT
jgi:hypothetical protein